MEGLFITFEGPEGAGKSTQARLLAEWYQAKGREVVLTREPGGTELGLALRRIVLSRPMRPETEFLLYSADRAEHAATVIRPALQRGAVVLCDRWMDSSLAYQGYGRGLSLEWMQAVSQGFLGGLRPHLTFLLTLPPRLGLWRARQRRGQEPDRFEEEELAFHERVLEGFHKLAEAEPQRFVVVDVQHPPAEAVQQRLREALRERGWA
ncbi:Thymidylate kinase [Meiothermus luteus]|jgi:dTMP kinase|uniref:Thymidylate kinase n=1 Tax=Meiothermus luteus TaxID=2026184 RepID=A0A399EWT2_9DEIN|nr:dTMP kinase [Meiothermus luteus]RIH86721.1 Thymidylate kinase [Meiothermus luteus]RMH54185.1 MAG: dTMP kinase [Deinococcota bacterium]